MSVEVVIFIRRSRLTRFQRWAGRMGLLTWARRLGWAPVADVLHAREERDMNIQETIRLQERIEHLEQRLRELGGEP